MEIDLEVHARYWRTYPACLEYGRTLEEFDFDRVVKRLGVAERIEPINPDLRPFKAAGGKLLTYTGWNDALEGVLRTVDYYETAEKVIGGPSGDAGLFPPVRRSGNKSLRRRRWR